MVFKNNRPAGNLKFATYDAARNYARKLVRKKFPYWNVFSESPPALSDFGYSVKRV